MALPVGLPEAQPSEALGRSISDEELSGDELDQLPELRGLVVVTKTLLGEMHYVIRLIYNRTGKHKHIMRRYEDFVLLDRGLRTLMTAESSGSTEACVSDVPTLPSAGRLGIRSSLSSFGLSGFNDRLKDGLQNYLDAVLLQVTSIDKVPPLLNFCDSAITEKMRIDWGAPRLRPAIVKTMSTLVTEPREGAQEPNPITENDVALVFASHLGVALSRMDEESKAHDVERSEAEVNNTKFNIGDTVIITGLMNKPHHNFKECIVVDILADIGQYRLKLPNGKLKRTLAKNIRSPIPRVWEEVWTLSNSAEETTPVNNSNAVRGWARFALRVL